jgi:UDP-N-acetylmuramoyl-tripeptide--D-alanyl-D-alanine ligase
VVTSVGHSHTERVGGVEGVARVKRELVEALPASGTAVLNADDHRVSAMAVSTGASVITFGRKGDVRLSGLELDERARPSFVVDTPWGSSSVRLAVAGAHMASNAAAAIAVAGVLGVDLGAAVDALRTAEVSGMRMEVTTTPSGAIVVNDAYNANPTSMRAALDAVAAMAASRRIAVLGLMAELDEPGPAHREIAAYALDLGIEIVPTGVDLYGVGPVDDPIEALGPLGPGDVVLVKASRSAGLESVVAALLAP